MMPAATTDSRRRPHFMRSFSSNAPRWPSRFSCHSSNAVLYGDRPNSAATSVLVRSRQRRSSQCCSDSGLITIRSTTESPLICPPGWRCIKRNCKDPDARLSRGVAIAVTQGYRQAMSGGWAASRRCRDRNNTVQRRQAQPGLHRRWRVTRFLGGLRFPPGDAPVWPRARTGRVFPTNGCPVSGVVGVLWDVDVHSHAALDGQRVVHPAKPRQGSSGPE